MDEDVKRRYHRERLAIGRESFDKIQGHTQIVAPIVTRRPEIDAMLADTAFLTKFVLERLREQVSEKPREQLSKDQIKEYEIACEMTIKQAKTEMEVEKFMRQRDSDWTPDKMKALIQSACERKNVPSEVVSLVFEAIGLSRPPSGSKSPP
jgi:hypothetical protein